MVTQVNLKIFIGAKKSSLEEVKRRSKINIDENLYLEGKLGEVISFEEYKKVWVELEGNEGDYVTFEKKNKEYIRIEVGSKPIILTLGEENVDMLNPGVYEVSVFTRGKEFKGTYKVSPSIISYEELMELEEFIKGSIQDFDKGDMYNLEELGKILDKRYNIIYRELNLISKDNDKCLNMDNRIVKRLDSMLRRISLQYKAIIKVQEADYLSKIKTYNLLEDKNEYRDNNMNYINRYLKENKFKMHLKNIQIDTLKDKLYKLYSEQKKVARLRSLLNDIEVKNKNFCSRMNYTKDKDINSKLKIFASKIYGCVKREQVIKLEHKTSDIFEKAILLKLSQILIQNGYKTNSLKDIYTFGQIAEEITLKFENQHQIIELDYNVEIERYPKNIDKSQIVNIISKNCRPDIKLTIYDKSYKLKECIIIEIKCSKAKYLYAEEIFTDKFLQILNYYALGTYDSGKKRIVSGGVSKVIVPYPKQEVSIYCDKYNIDFVPLDVNMDLLEENSASRFQNILKDYL